MCGILAAVRKADGPFDFAACRRALSRLSWRGPDLCVSSSWGDRVFLGQTVLSLCGDIEGDGAGAYTLSKSGRYGVAFNGEIYNYRDLASRWLGDRLPVTAKTTDTEVLANLHDVLAIDRVPGELDGMYAYALLDKTANTLSIARDLQGEKSLYIYEDDDVVVIASEIPAVRSLVPPTELDVQVLRDYFRTRHYMHGSRTPYRRIRQLLPGTVETLDLRTMQWRAASRRSLREWIDPARMEANATRSLDDLADELDALLTQCARDMRPDGRKYAAVISGGIDSSLVGSYLVKEGSPDTLIAVEHIGKDRISSDLSGFERALGRPIEVLRIDHVPYSAEVVRCQHTCDSPLPSHSFVPQSLQSARVRLLGSRALFGGEGGDEVFGGYGAYLSAGGEKTRFSPSPYTTHDEPEVSFLEDDPSLIQAELERVWCEAVSAYEFVEPPAERTALAMMYADAAHQLAAVGLRGADLMSMMWSVEARTMLIRRPLLQFALNLPLRAKLDPAAADPKLRTKVLLKRVFLRHYPAELLLDKQGFAGFPNESAAFLGDPADYVALDVLGIRRRTATEPAYGRATGWKLANIEYFLRFRH
jgi:asparagine synthase (glutamine-hydrolysing)